jgi:hypothetical protein
MNDIYTFICERRLMTGVPENAFEARSGLRTAIRRMGLVALFGVIVLASMAFAQTRPRVTGVDPQAGKVNDNITITGESLGKSSVSAVFLSDDKSDYKATIVEQTEEKIIAKVPQAKPGDYNVSIQTGNNILIEPVKFKIQE